MSLFGFRMIFLTFWLSATYFTGVLALAEGPKNKWDEALAAYSSQDWEKAADIWGQLILETPESADLHYNLGRTRFEQKKMGLALASLRTALVIQPSHSEALEVLARIERETIHLSRSNPGTWEILRLHLLRGLNPNAFFLILWLLILFSGCLWIKFEKRRQRARIQEETVPQRPLLHWVYLALAIGVFTVSLMAWYDLSILRGTVVAEKIELRSQPNDQSVILGEFAEGVEVQFRTRNNEWDYVFQPNGLGGWVRSNQIQWHRQIEKNEGGG